MRAAVTRCWPHLGARLCGRPSPPDPSGRGPGAARRAAADCDAVSARDLNQRIAARGKLKQRRGAGDDAAAGLGPACTSQVAGTCHGNLSATNVFFCRCDDLAVDSPLSDGKGNTRLVLIDAGLTILDGNQPSSADDQRALGRMLSSFVSDLSPATKQVLSERGKRTPTRAIAPSPICGASSMKQMGNKPGPGGKSQVRVVATTVAVGQVRP